MQLHNFTAFEFSLKTKMTFGIKWLNEKMEREKVKRGEKLAGG